MWFESFSCEMKISPKADNFFHSKLVRGLRKSFLLGKNNNVSAQFFLRKVIIYNLTTQESKAHGDLN